MNIVSFVKQKSKLVLNIFNCLYMKITVVINHFTAFYCYRGNQNYIWNDSK